MLRKTSVVPPAATVLTNQVPLALVTPFRLSVSVIAPFDRVTTALVPVFENPEVTVKLPSRATEFVGFVVD